MITKPVTVATLIAAATMLISAPMIAQADIPGKHPGFLHALTDLRSARWLIRHRPGDAAVNSHEGPAVEFITAAISDIQRAAIDDGKNLDDHPAADDATLPDQGRLQRALEALEAAYRDVNSEEDNPAARELRKVALKNIDEATKEVKAALWDVSHGR
jgi:hypothetical protein